MPFGIIGRTGPGMRHVVAFADPSTGRSTFGANLARAIVTNGDFTASRETFAATRPSSQITLGRLVRMLIRNVITVLLAESAVAAVSRLVAVR